MSINIIVAIADNLVIGNGDSLPWPKIKEDFKWFKDKTVNSTVIMGRKTFESIGGVLPNRRNIIVTSSPENYKTIEAYTLDDIKTKINYLGDVYIIGGSQLITELFDIVDTAYVTRIHGVFDGDVMLDIDLLMNGNFNKIEDLKFSSEIGCELNFETWTRKT